MTFFHTPAWSEILDASFPSFRPLWITARDDGRLSGFMPAVRAGKGLFHSLYSLPFGTYGTPVADDASTRNRILEAFIDKARGPGCLEGVVNLFSLEEGTETTPPPGCRMEECSIIDLEGGFERYRSRSLSRKKRQICNGCEREGIDVRPLESEEEMEEFYAIYLSGSAGWGGVHPYPKVFFERLLEASSEGVLVLGAFLGGRMLGGHIDLFFGDIAQGWQAGMSPGRDAPGAASYLIYSAVREACERGIRYFNLGSSGGDDGMIFFKESMGGKRHLYPVWETGRRWFRWIRRR